MKIRTGLLVLLVLMLLEASAQRAKGGILDLSKSDFSSGEIALDGEWEFYWNELLQPEEIQRPGLIRPFPSVWTDLEINGEELPAQGYATYRLHLILPDTDQEYMLHLEDMFSAFKLFVNGKLVYKNGEVATEKSAYTPEWKPDFIEFANTRDTNELVLQIANFDHRLGGSSQSLAIGEEQLMRDRELRILSYDLLLTGSLLMGGLFFFGLYFFGRHDRAKMFFSLFCIVYAYRVIGAGYYTLHHLIDASWYILIRLEYISLFLSVYLFSRFLEALYPYEINKVFYQVINVICIGFSIVTLFFPVYIFSHLSVPFVVILMGYLGFALIVYLKAYRKKLVGSSYALLSTAIVLAVFFFNSMVYLGFLPDWKAISFWGHILFFFSQSLILSFRFSYFLKEERDRARIASEAKSDFLSTISHEIRTPLNAVVGMSHLLLQEKPRKDQKENLMSLKYSAEHLTALINDILDYNKLESGTVEFEEMHVNLHDLGRRVYQAYLPKAEEKGLKLTYQCDKNIKSSLILDATRLSQVLNNLIDNAIKFTQKGEVNFSISLVSDEEDRQKIYFEIKDSGIGIPAGKMGVIFERFTQASSSTTREFGGSGLGLSIIKKLLELQGSEIKVNSEEGKGSVFHFTKEFKKGSDTNQSLVFDEGDENSDIQDVRVLLVEDNKMNVMVATKFLSRWGVQFEVAQDGRQAVEMVLKKTYDLVLMDLQMPEMDGYEASREIRKSNELIPIVALTASALLKVQEKVYEAGMNDFVTKPFDPKELKRKIAKNLRRSLS